nr:hypothetical protein [Tanacetum cinerariifolium]
MLMCSLTASASLWDPKISDQSLILSLIDDPSVNNVHGSESSSLTLTGAAEESSSGRSTMKSAKICPLTDILGLYCFVYQALVGCSDILQLKRNFLVEEYSLASNECCFLFILLCHFDLVTANRIIAISIFAIYNMIITTRRRAQFSPLLPVSPTVIAGARVLRFAAAAF